MMRILCGVSLLAATLVGASALAAGTDRASTNAVPNTTTASAKLAIDVGHSSLHAGATSARGKTEFEFNRALAQTISDYLQEQHTAHSLIGIDGKMVDLTKRTALAHSMGATFFLAVHHDSAQEQFLETWQWQGTERRYSDKFSGYSLFVSRKNPQLGTSLRCATSIGNALQAAGLSPSPHHAEKIKGESREWADQAAGVYYFDDLVVLKTSTMPAILLEAGVIINRDEELVLQQEERKQLVAKAVLQGLRGCGALP